MLSGAPKIVLCASTVRRMHSQASATYHVLLFRDLILYANPADSDCGHSAHSATVFFLHKIKNSGILLSRSKVGYNFQIFNQSGGASSLSPKVSADVSRPH